jgi:hypothetical protein
MSELMRDVVDGETLSGHRTEDGYPELMIYDGQGAGRGSMICTIRSFHNSAVRIEKGTTTLIFESRFPIKFHGGNHKPGSRNLRRRRLTTGRHGFGCAAAEIG